MIKRRKGNAPRRHGKAYHHGDLRNAAIAEVVKHIRRTGDTSFTLRELAKRLHVSSTALYRHFESKQALLAAIAAEGFREMGELAARRDDLLEHDPRAVLAARGFAYVRFAVEHAAHFRVMFSPEANDTKRFPELRKVRDIAYDGMRRALAKLQEQGLLVETPLDDLAMSTWALVHGVASLLVNAQLEGTETREKALDAGVRMLRILGRALQPIPRSDR